MGSVKKKRSMNSFLHTPAEQRWRNNSERERVVENTVFGLLARASISNLAKSFSTEHTFTSEAEADLCRKCSSASSTFALLNSPLPSTSTSFEAAETFVQKRSAWNFLLQLMLCCTRTRLDGDQSEAGVRWSQRCRPPQVKKQKKKQSGECIPPPPISGKFTGRVANHYNIYIIIICI